MIDREGLSAHLKRLREEGIEYEVIFRVVGESEEESNRKILSSKIFREELVEIGNINH